MAEIVEVAGVEYKVIWGDVTLVEHPDGSIEHVDDFEAWVGERKPATDGGRQPFGGDTCPMCGSAFDSYTTHLQHCQPR